MSEVFIHPVAPVFNQNSKILILGTFPSPKSREIGFFYGHPQNRFWKVLATLFQEPLPVSILEKKSFLLKHYIALWDVIHSCSIQGADDNSIKDVIPNDISLILEKSKIQAIFTTGKKAYALYQKYCFSKTNFPATELPSTSPANCRVHLEELVEKYQIILDYLN